MSWEPHAGQGVGGQRGDKHGYQRVERGDNGAIEEPLRQIANNAGLEGSVVIDKVKGEKGSFGYNAASDIYEDLLKAGVLDPTKVVRLALQNAASVASLMLTTQAMVADKPEEKQDAMPGGGGGMPGGMGGGMGGMGGMM